MKASRNRRPRKAPAQDLHLQVNEQEIEELLGRLKGQLSPEDFAQFATASQTVLDLARLLQRPGTSLAQLRRRASVGAP